MRRSILLRAKKKLYFRDITNLNKKRTELEIAPDDNIYIEENGMIETVWRLCSESKTTYRFEQVPGKAIKDGCNVSELSSEVNQNKDVVVLLGKEDSEHLRNIFEHKIQIYPQYALNNVLEKDERLISGLKSADPRIEFYYNQIMDGNNKNSLVIIPTYGICIIETLSDNDLAGFREEDKFIEKINQREELSVDEDKTYLISEQALISGNKLNIGYLRYILCDKLTDELICKLNKKLEKVNSTKRFIKLEDLIKKIKELSSGETIVVDDIKKYGIKCALMPGRVIRKTEEKYKETDDGKLKIPSSSFAINDMQFRILDELNEAKCIEATAGTGKSAILLTKAYEMARENPNKEFLLVCYNTYLSAELQNQAKYKNQQAENLKITTFSTLAKKSLGIIGKVKSEEWERIYSVFLEKIKAKQIKQKYGGIFIDEMQQLAEEWKLALYQLLDSNKYMILVGDYNQDIRYNPEQYLEDEEDLSEEIDEEKDKQYYYLGDIAFEKIVLNRNYRNTIQITRGINNLINEIKKYREEYKIGKGDDSVLGTSSTDGEKPKYIRINGNEKVKNKVLEIIDNLVKDKNIIESEIIILYPPANRKAYGLINTISSAIENAGLQLNDLNKKEAKITDPGIKLCTIGKAIGLDFKTVIIVGLDNIKKSNVDDKIDFNDAEKLKTSKIKIRRELIQNMKNIYVAASRAKEYLYVIDDIEEENNIISKYVKKIEE